MINENLEDGLNMIMQFDDIQEFFSFKLCLSIFADLSYLFFFICTVFWDVFDINKIS